MGHVSIALTSPATVDLGKKHVNFSNKNSPIGAIFYYVLVKSNLEMQSPRCVIT